MDLTIQHHEEDGDWAIYGEDLILGMQLHAQTVSIGGFSEGIGGRSRGKLERVLRGGAPEARGGTSARNLGIRASRVRLPQVGQGNPWSGRHQRELSSRPGEHVAEEIMVHVYLLFYYFLRDRKSVV